MKLRYKSVKRYKYQLIADYSVKTPIKGFRVNTRYLDLWKRGKLTIRKGYSCDGASGPTYDTMSTMRAAFVHDAFYQLIRMNELPIAVKCDVDKLFYDIMLEDGVWKIRAWTFYRAVMKFGWSSCKPGTERPHRIYSVPV